MNNLLFAARPILYDLLGVIVFAALIAFKVDLVATIVLGVGVSMAVVAWQLVRKKPVAALQWVSLALVIVSAVAAFVTRDVRFLMAKATVAYAAVGAAMLQRGWMNRYVPPIAMGRVEHLMDRFGYVWAGLMFTIAAANLVIAIGFPAWWAGFTGVVPSASNLALFAVQYVVVRRRARASIQADRAAEGTAAQA